MDDDALIDGLFCEAVSAIDAGDVAALQALLAAHPGWFAIASHPPARGCATGRRRSRRVFQTAVPAVVCGGGSGPQRQAAAQHRHGGANDHRRGPTRGRRHVCKSSSTTRCGSCAGPGSHGSAACRSSLIDVLLDAGASPDGRHRLRRPLRHAQRRRDLQPQLRSGRTTPGARCAR